MDNKLGGQMGISPCDPQTVESFLRQLRNYKGNGPAQENAKRSNAASPKPLSGNPQHSLSGFSHEESSQHCGTSQAHGSREGAREHGGQELHKLKQKIERRQQQNREAARKSRQRKREQVAKLEEENAYLRSLLDGPQRKRKKHPSISPEDSPLALIDADVAQSGSQLPQEFQSVQVDPQCVETPPPEDTATPQMDSGQTSGQGQNNGTNATNGNGTNGTGTTNGTALPSTNNGNTNVVSKVSNTNVANENQPLPIVLRRGDSCSIINTTLELAAVEEKGVGNRLQSVLSVLEEKQQQLCRILDSSAVDQAEYKELAEVVERYLQLSIALRMRALYDSAGINQGMAAPQEVLERMLTWHGGLSPSLHIKALLKVLQAKQGFSLACKELLDQLFIITQIKESSVDMRLKSIIDDFALTLLAPTTPSRNPENQLQQLMEQLTQALQLQLDTLRHIKTLTCFPEYVQALVIPYKLQQAVRYQVKTSPAPQSSNDKDPECLIAPKEEPPPLVPQTRGMSATHVPYLNFSSGHDSAPGGGASNPSGNGTFQSSTTQIGGGGPTIPTLAQGGISKATNAAGTAAAAAAAAPAGASRGVSGNGSGNGNGYGYGNGSTSINGLFGGSSAALGFGETVTPGPMSIRGSVSGLQLGGGGSASGDQVGHWAGNGCVVATNSTVQVVAPSVVHVLPNSLKRATSPPAEARGATYEKAATGFVPVDKESRRKSGLGGGGSKSCGKAFVRSPMLMQGGEGGDEGGGAVAENGKRRGSGGSSGEDGDGNGGFNMASSAPRRASVRVVDEMQS